jgi:glyoxylase-like metal-dependent hydrolase (beta-lactamase superfamily II)
MSNVFVKPLYEGTFSVALDKIFNRISREDPPHKGALKLSINPFLIDEGDRKILFDAGIGDLFGGDTSIQTILDNLDEESISDFEITDIFLSHLHFDHMAGIANMQNGYWELTFPESTVWVSESGWKQLRTAIDKQDEEKRDFFHFVDSHAKLKFLSADDNPIPNVKVKRIGGHTEFHQVLFYENGEDRFLMAGDVIGTKGAINRTYAAKYDFNPEESMKARKDLQELAYKEGYTIMAYHETDHPLFMLSDYDEKKGYTIKPRS